MLSAVALGLRGFQALFSIVVLGLAATLIKGQIIGDSPTTTRYSTFTGGFGIIVAAVGAAGLFLSAIPEIVLLGLDALAGVFFAAGGIAWAIGLRGITCNMSHETEDAKLDAALNSGLINQGRRDTPNGPYYGIFDGEGRNENVALQRLNDNCKKGLADEIFQFLCFGLAIGLLALGYIRMRKGGKTGTTYV